VCAVHGDDADLVGRHCRWCGTSFGVCRSCYRGQAYCQEECRRQARRGQCVRANRKYLAGLREKERRRDAAARALAYRQRRREGVAPQPHRRFVIDQRSDSSRLMAEIPTGPTRCLVCGRRGKVVRWLS
jgi:hypothetical protein